MAIELKSGNDKISFALPSHTDILTTRDPEYTINRDDFGQLVKDQLKKINGENFERTVIVISDKTRLCGYDNYLPWLTDILEKEGCTRENITFIIAYGTHPRQTDEESLASYGPIYNQYRFVHHDCDDEAMLATIGTTKRGTHIRIRKEIMEATLLITFGAISHHYFAGYGGGRKLIFPGLGARASIYQNHSLFLDMEHHHLEQHCQPGNLEGNPLSDDLKEVDDMLPEKISIHGILNGKGKVCQLMAGITYDDFLSACRKHDSYFRSENKNVYDLVVASAGGYPKDINFIQSHKSVHNASAFVKDNGTLILLAECRDGLGNKAFPELFRAGGWDAIFVKMEKHYEGNGGTALAMLAKSRRINIKLVTSLSEDTCHMMGAEKINAEKAFDLIAHFSGSVAAIPNASMLVK